MAETILKETGANIPAIKIYSDKFEDQVVVVTGAAQGIGKATPLLLRGRELLCSGSCRHSSRQVRTGCF